MAGMWPPITGIGTGCLLLMRFISRQKSVVLLCKYKLPSLELRKVSCSGGAWVGLPGTRPPSLVFGPPSLLA